MRCAARICLSEWVAFEMPVSSMLLHCCDIFIGLCHIGDSERKNLQSRRLLFGDMKGSPIAHTVERISKEQIIGKLLQLARSRTCTMSTN